MQVVHGNPHTDKFTLTLNYNGKQYVYCFRTQAERNFALIGLQAYAECNFTKQ